MQGKPMTPEDAWQEWCAETERDPQNTLLWATFMSGYEACRLHRLEAYEAALREIADTHQNCIGVPVDSEACSFFANTVNHVQEIARKALETK